MPLEVPGFDGGDRTSIALPKAQRDLLDALEATGKPVVIVLQSGSAVALGENGRKANAILEAWYPGEKGGQAIAEVLRGTDRKSVVEGKSVSVRVDLGGRRIIKKKKNNTISRKKQRQDTKKTKT